MVQVLEDKQSKEANSVHGSVNSQGSVRRLGGQQVRSSLGSSVAAGGGRSQDKEMASGEYALASKKDRERKEDDDKFMQIKKQLQE